MNVLLRCVVLALGASAAVYLLVALLSAARWRLRPPAADGAVQADALLRLRLLPAICAAGALLFAAIGLYRFESRDGDEVLGFTFWALATIGVGLAGVVVTRLIRMHRQTRRLLRLWLRDATPIALPGITIPALAIDAGYPVVAIVGIVRPRLFIDRSVLQTCPEDELRAILAHEQGHLSRRDNLRRLAFAAAPGIGLTRALERVWRDATEDAADDCAVGAGDTGRLHLASALLRVSRLIRHTASPDWQDHLPASALFRGESLEHRVRRLVGETPPVAAAPRRVWWPVAAAGVVAAFVLQRDLHDVMEAVVAALP